MEFHVWLNAKGFIPFFSSILLILSLKLKKNMKQNFKKGLAVVLSIMTALAVVALNADRLNAMGETLDGIMGITLTIITTIIALPCWLVTITMWQKLHKTSYVAFKNWCIYQANELTRA